MNGELTLAAGALAAATATTTAVAPANPLLSFLYPLGGTQYTFAKIVQFSPRGEGVIDWKKDVSQATVTFNPASGERFTRKAGVADYRAAVDRRHVIPVSRPNRLHPDRTPKEPCSLR